MEFSLVSVGKGKDGENEYGKGYCEYEDDIDGMVSVRRRLLK